MDFFRAEATDECRCLRELLDRDFESLEEELFSEESDKIFENILSIFGMTFISCSN